MSNAVFPVMIGLSWDIGRIPNFSTTIHMAASGRESRLSMMTYPTWTFSMKYEVLRSSAAYLELQTLCGFFLSRQGSFDSFLFTDPDDNSVTDQSFGTGDALTNKFQLLRSWGGYIEPVMNVNAITNIKVNGVTIAPTTGYTIDSAGMVTFVTTPASGATITWTGSYYYRVRFKQDAAEFNKMMRDLWELKKLELIGSPMNKV